MIASLRMDSEVGPSTKCSLWACAAGAAPRLPSEAHTCFRLGLIGPFSAALRNNHGREIIRRAAKPSDVGGAASSGVMRRAKATATERRAR